MTKRPLLFAWIVWVLAFSNAIAQTTAGIGTTIVFPVAVETGAFNSDVWIYNPGSNPLIAHVTFFQANNSSVPGPQVCSDLVVAADRSVQFSLATQCNPPTGPRFGLLIVADSANPQSNSFYGYSLVQNPRGIGFSVEGFPVQNFSNQVSHATGLKRGWQDPTYQTNVSSAVSISR